MGANKRARREAEIWAQEIARQDKLVDRMDASILEDVNTLSRKVREDIADDKKNGASFNYEDNTEEASLLIIPELPTRDSETGVGREETKRESPNLVHIPSKTEIMEKKCTPNVETISGPEDTDTVVVTPVEDPPRVETVVSHLEEMSPNEEEVDDHFDDKIVSGSDKSYHAHINLNLISAFVKLAAATVEEEDVSTDTSVEEKMMAPIEVSNPVEEVAAQVEEVTAAVAAVLEEFANPIDATVIERKPSRISLLTDDWVEDKNEGTEESDGEVDASSGYSTIEDSSLDLKLDGEEDEDVDGQGIFSLTEIEGSFADALQEDESFVLKEANKELLAPAEA